MFSKIEELQTIVEREEKRERERERERVINKKLHLFILLNYILVLDTVFI